MRYSATCNSMRSNTWIVPASLAVAIKIFSFFPYLVERIYSTGIFPVAAQTLRLLFGWIPFSIGDIFYITAGVYLLRKMFLFTSLAIKKQLTGKLFIRIIQKVVFTCLLIYVLFNLLWGLNYNRIPMAQQVGLQLHPYSTQNLQAVAKALVNKLNSFDSAKQISRLQLSNNKALFQEAVYTYTLAQHQYPLLKYASVSVKPSLFSYAGNYIGFTGYYNPFSGEAQTNTTIPAFVQPFTTCHEIGHQLGYAKENEANFAGFLSARLSADPDFRYSVYFDMYSYVMSEMVKRDSAGARGFNEQLHNNVKEDFKALRAFYRRYENPFGVVIWKLYAHYLRANQQPSGLNSYNEVVAMLVAFYSKYRFI